MTKLLSYFVSSLKILFSLRGAFLTHTLLLMIHFKTITVKLQIFLWCYYIFMLSVSYPCLSVYLHMHKD